MTINMKQKTHTISPLPEILIEPLVRATLAEDLGRAGDITSDAIIPVTVQSELYLVARKPGVLAGLDLARLAFQLIDKEVIFEVLLEDGARLQQGSRIARITGSARALLTAERTALNFLCHLSGIATVTAQIADSIAEYSCHVTCTRKTTPMLRALEKYAVRVGGGRNHRFGLDDAVLIKDNHIAVAGSLTTAVERARAAVGHLVKIEVEVDTLEQLDEALAIGVDVVLLDKMSLEQLAEAVRRIDGRAISEASGGVTPETAVKIAQQGVNQIAIGWITHSAPILDIGLDVI